MPIILVTALTASTADAKKHRVYCGSRAVSNDTGKFGWTYDETNGAGDFDLYAYKVGCHTARRVVSSTKSRPFGFTCHTRQTGYESSKTRCTRSGGRWISWVSGA